MVDLKYIGHSAFIIKNDDKAVIIDPWVEKNAEFKSDVKVDANKRNF